MKKTTSSKLRTTIITLLLIMMFVCGGLGIGKYSVRVDNDTLFTGISGSPTGATLYSTTNNFEYKGANTNKDRFYEYYNTSESGRNNNTVSAGVPKRKNT